MQPLICAHFLASFFSSKVSVSGAEIVFRQFLPDLMHSDAFAEHRHARPPRPLEGRIRTLAQRVVEVAGSALIARVPFKSRSTQTLSCLAVTGAIVLTGAGALAGWKARRALVNKQLLSVLHF